LKQTQDIVSKVKSTVYGHGRGWCFTASDFLGDRNPVAVRQALSRLQRSGSIRRVAWGIYEYPRKHPKLGLLPPDLQQVVKAVARRDNLRVLPSGAAAANLLGLSDQVPAKVVFLTDGLTKRIRVGKREVLLKNTTVKNMTPADTFAGLAIQALKHLGKDRVDSVVLGQLKRRIGQDERQSLQKFGKYAPVWIRKTFRTLIGEEKRG
jgi:hypothetical protein